MRLVIALVLTLASLRSYATTINVQGFATFHATGHPGIVNVDGEGAHVAGQVEQGADGKVAGTFVVKLAPLTTGMRMRDTHMHERYLEDGKYPEARLVLKPWQRSAAAAPFTGLFLLHGQTHDVSGTASVSSDGKLHAEFDVDVTAYGITAPEMGPVTVEPKVHVTVEAEVQ